MRKYESFFKLSIFKFVKTKPHFLTPTLAWMGLGNGGEKETEFEGK